MEARGILQLPGLREDLKEDGVLAIARFDPPQQGSRDPHRKVAARGLPGAGQGRWKPKQPAEFGWIGNRIVQGRRGLMVP